MALFLGVHDFGGPTTDDDIKNKWANYQAACQKRGCKTIRLHYNTGRGNAFCLTEASSADEVQAAHDDAQPDIKDIIEVQILE